MAKDESEQNIWARVFNPATNSLRSGGTTANPPADTDHPFQEVLNRSFDADANKLRMNA